MQTHLLRSRTFVTADLPPAAVRRPTGVDEAMRRASSAAEIQQKARRKPSARRVSMEAFEALNRARGAVLEGRSPIRPAARLRRHRDRRLDPGPSSPKPTSLPFSTATRTRHRACGGLDGTCQASAILTASMEPSRASAISSGWLLQARRCSSAIPLASLGQASLTDSLAEFRPEPQSVRHDMRW